MKVILILFRMSHAGFVMVQANDMIETAFKNSGKKFLGSIMKIRPVVHAFDNFFVGNQFFLISYFDHFYGSDA